MKQQEPWDAELEKLHAMRRASAEFALQQEDDDEYERHVFRRELELLEIVKRGDVCQMLENRESNVFPGYAQFIDFSAEKTEEYVAVLTVSIASCAAIDAGLISEDCFQLSALYLRKIALARPDRQEYERIRWEALIAFTRLVEENRRPDRVSVYVEECKQFIAANIFKKISIRDVAEALNLNPVYLE